jgi:hypothetical protein
MLLQLLDNRSKLTMTNKLLLYNTTIKPIRTYGHELWGSTKPSNLRRIQSSTKTWKFLLLSTLHQLKVYLELCLV